MFAFFRCVVILAFSQCVVIIAVLWCIVIIAFPRCVVCRDGVAVEMSFDHKPEDEVDLCKHKTLSSYQTKIIF